MAKAIRQIKRAAAARKPRAPFKLNTQARMFLEAHQEFTAAERAYEAAVIREHGKQWNDPSFRDGLVSSADARARCTVMLAKRQAVEDIAARIATCLKRKKRPTLDDVLLLGMAGWHANTYHALCHAIPKAAGIDMTAAA